MSKSPRLITDRQKQVIGAEGFASRASLARESFAERGYPIPSQAWLAARASTFLDGDAISQPTMGKWLTGKAVPESPARAWAFAQALGVDPGWLVFGSESGAPAPEQLHPPAETVDRAGKEVPRPAAHTKKRAG